MKIILFACLFVFILPFTAAHAACSSPAAVEGEILYNSAYNVPQVCTDTVWVGLGIINPAAGGSGCTGPVGTEGAILYNNDFHKPQYCDGDIWIEMIGTVAVNSLAGPTGCENIGDQCADSTIFAGWHPVTHMHLFLHPNNQSASSDWSSEGVFTSSTSDDDGKANHDWIVANKTITIYPAFKLCDDLNIASALGYTDWYLPSRVEMYYFRTNRFAINAGPGDAFISTQYWSSTEAFLGTIAYTQNFAFGEQLSNNKSTYYGDVRCARRG